MKDSSATSSIPAETADAGQNQIKPEAHSHKKASLFSLALGSVGVVFGDIGTSPLYALKSALAHAADTGASPQEVIGIVSLLVWALILRSR